MDLSVFCPTLVCRATNSLWKLHRVPELVNETATIKQDTLVEAQRGNEIMENCRRLSINFRFEFVSVIVVIQPRWFFLNFMLLKFPYRRFFLRVRDSKVFNTLQADVFSVFPFNSFWWYICTKFVLFIDREIKRKRKGYLFVFTDYYLASVIFCSSQGKRNTNKFTNDNRFLTFLSISVYSWKNWS